MMNDKRILSSAALACVVGLISSPALAADKIDVDDFVEEASAKGIAEVESAKLAQQKSSSADVKAFAEKMIADHTAANIELAKIAGSKSIGVSDDAGLSSKAKQLMMEQRDGQSFDEAYADNQVDAHKDTIELFQRASTIDDAEIAAFAKKTLPKLEHHLKMAEELAAAHNGE